MSRTADHGALFAIDIAGRDAAPLHRRISDALRTGIEAGRLPAGTRLPSTRTLASEWKVSRNTVLQVFETLTAEGYLAGRVGDGTYVAALAAAPPVAAASERARAAAPEPRIGAASGTYPFRSVSQRGRILIAQSVGTLSERPVPFMPDVPDLRAFPLRSWLRIMNEVSGRLTGSVLVDVSNAGYGPLREAIARHLRVTRDIVCTPEEIIVTTGSQQSLDLVTRLLVERGDPVWIEDPGYFGTRAAIAANGCSVVPVATDREGLVVEDAVARMPAPRMIVVSPARNYPLGDRLSPDRAKALLEHAYGCGAWIVEDDYDSDFVYGGPPHRPLRSRDPQQRVVYVGTFSKTMLPSFRLGFIVAPSDLAADFARARAVVDRHAPILEQMVLAEFMHRGLYAAHLRRMRAIYGARQAALVGVLREELGYEVPPSQLAAGMHLVLPLAPGEDDIALARLLAGRGVMARPLSIYGVGIERRRGLLLGYAGFEESEIRRSGAALRDLAGRIADHASRGI